LTLCLGEGIRVVSHVLLQASVVGKELNVSAIDTDTAGRLLLQVLLAAERREAPVLRDNDLLPTGELVLGASESLESDSAV